MKKGFTLIELMIVVAIIAIIAAIAIPNLLESRMQANESNAIAALKEYATAQATWKKAKYNNTVDPSKPADYASEYTSLNTKDLIPDVFADATTSTSSGYQGYYFEDDNTNVENWAYDFGLWAFPITYEKSGVNSFHIGGAGTVTMNDQGGNEAQVDMSTATGWTVP